MTAVGVYSICTSRPGALHRNIVKSFISSCVNTRKYEKTVKVLEQNYRIVSNMNHVRCCFSVFSIETRVCHSRAIFICFHMLWEHRGFIGKSGKNNWKRQRIVSKWNAFELLSIFASKSKSCFPLFWPSWIHWSMLFCPKIIQWICASSPILQVSSLSIIWEEIWI